MLSSFKPCLNACSATTSLFINASNFVQRYFSMPYLRKLSLHSVVSRILQKREGHPGDGCRPRHSRRPDARKESNCTGSCDAEILARAQMFVQAKTEHIFAIIGTSETCDGKTTALLAHAQKSRIAFETVMRPWWLLGPTSPSNGFAGPAGRQAREFRTARITATLPRSRRRAWGPRCPGRWATCNKRWPRNSPGCRGARARARRAACRPRHARLAAA